MGSENQQPVMPGDRILVEMVLEEVKRYELYGPKKWATYRGPEWVVPCEARQLYWRGRGSQTFYVIEGEYEKRLKRHRRIFVTLEIVRIEETLSSEGFEKWAVLIAPEWLTPEDGMEYWWQSRHGQEFYVHESDFGELLEHRDSPALIPAGAA